MRAACMALALCLAVPASAAPCAPAVKLRRARVAHKGLPGVWVHLQVMRCMIADLEALPAIRAERDALRRRAKVADVLVDTLRKDRDLLASSLPRISSGLAKSIEGLKRCESERSPIKWFVLGAATSAAVAIGVAVAVGLIGGST